MTIDLFKIIAKHYQLQYGCFFSSIQVRDGILYAYNDIIHCPIWNHCCFTPDSICDDIDQLMEEAKRYLASRNRHPCVYIGDRKKTKLDTVLSEKGFICVDNEAWLIYEGKRSQLQVNDTLEMKVVTNEQLLEGFIDICNSCFDIEYGETIRREYYQYQPHKTVFHCVLFLNTKRVAAASVYYSDNYFYIHNVGVLAEYRKHGYGYAVMTKVLEHIFSIDNMPIIILQCDGGGFVEQFYKKIGFSSIHRRWGYTYDG